MSSIEALLKNNLFKFCIIPNNHLLFKRNRITVRTEVYVPSVKL